MQIEDPPSNALPQNPSGFPTGGASAVTPYLFIPVLWMLGMEIDALPGWWVAHYVYFLLAIWLAVAFKSPGLIAAAIGGLYFIISLRFGGGGTNGRAGIVLAVVFYGFLLNNHQAARSVTQLMQSRFCMLILGVLSFADLRWSFVDTGSVNLELKFLFYAMPFFLGLWGGSSKSVIPRVGLIFVLGFWVNLLVPSLRFGAFVFSYDTFHFETLLALVAAFYLGNALREKDINLERPRMGRIAEVVLLMGAMIVALVPIKATFPELTATGGTISNWLSNSQVLALVVGIYVGIRLVGWIFSPPRKFLESCRGLVE